MRLVGPIATTLLVLGCGTFGDNIGPPTTAPEKQAEIARLRIIAEAYRSIKIELSDIGKGRGIAGPETLGRAVNYSVKLNNPTEHAHMVNYSIHWTAGAYVPTETGMCSRWKELGIILRWPDEPLRGEVLQPFTSVTRPFETSALPGCFEIDPMSGGASIYLIDGFDPSLVEYRIAELEGHEIEY